ncbi:hypothetical protein HNP40_003865 [Mycobacteroides chelonae]|nr:hypothetical protein [Mycobacteroides chelonae]
MSVGALLRSEVAGCAYVQECIGELFVSRRAPDGYNEAARQS